MELSKFYVSCVGNLCVTERRDPKPPKVYKIVGVSIQSDGKAGGKPMFRLKEIK
jgi:hypothetical protein